MKKEICEDCACLIEKDGEWCCEECFGQKIVDIDDCPEGFSMEEFDKIENQAKEVKINHKAKKITEKQEKKKKTSKPKKVSDTKKEIFSYILEKMNEFSVENDAKVTVPNENKLIFVEYGGKKYKIDLIEQRK